MSMKKLLSLVTVLAVLASCHESIEERAAREAQEYTKKYCPSPVVNYVRTDSTVFDIETKTYCYYSTLVGRMDNDTIIRQHQAVLQSGLLEGIREDTNIRGYKKAGFNFAYVLHSDREPTKVLFKVKYTPKEYN